MYQTPTRVVVGHPYPRNIDVAAATAVGPSQRAWHPTGNGRGRFGIVLRHAPRALPEIM